jgi:hypothetical protein
MKGEKKMKKNIAFLKGAFVLLVSAVLLFSVTALAVTADKIFIMNSADKTGRLASVGDFVWDNNMTYENLLACQNDPVYGELGSDADDFQLTATTEFCAILWIGGYWNGNPGATSWQITIYADDGTGNAPGAVLWGPTTFPYADCNEEFVEQISASYYYSYWVFFSPGFTAQAGVKYWIGWQGQLTFPPQSGIAGHSLVTMHEEKFKSTYFGYPTWTDASAVFGEAYDIAFALGGWVLPPEPKLACIGSLGWSDVKAGDTVNGSFQVGNVGDHDSYLNWQVSSWPSWGTWTFTPAAGTGLAQGDWVTVSVSVVAPGDKKTNFTGNVTIVNTENASDFYVIPVYLHTPLYQGLHNRPFLERLFERFPHAFPILRQLMGY